LRVIAHVPGGFLAERTYAVQVLLTTFLGVEEVVVRPEDRQNYELVLPNAKTIEVDDSFFGACLPEGQYLSVRRIPASVKWMSHEWCGARPLPIIYGGDGLRIEANRILIRADLFASTFFMLTRWEETVSPSRDLHGRFPAGAAFAQRAGFLDLPIVDAYAGILRHAFAELGMRLPTPGSFHFFNTHDVDEPFTFKSRREALRASGGALLKRGNLRECLHALSLTAGVGRDLLDTYDELMDISESLGGISTFFLLAEGQDPFDNAYSLEGPAISRIGRRILQRGHEIGLHGGYRTMNDLGEFREQKQRLEDRFGIRVTQNRQHFLRFEAPGTWRLLDAAGIVTDSSCGYVEQEGFRCGTGRAFPVFDVEQQRQLRLLERPMVLMDGTLYVFRRPDFESGLETARRLIANARTYGSDITFLIHNTFRRCQTFVDVYEQVVADLGGRGASKVDSKHGSP
jgi:peptidoglycan/xylan/chitin deacetylase (PgdA/CDA1 family)